MNRILVSMVLWLGVSALPAQTVGANDAPEAQVTEGRLQGKREAGGVRAFLGIPYARPPVGELRWREPQPPEAWSGLRPAVEFGPRPLQRMKWADMIFRSRAMSEDCLYLNVWAPAAGAEPAAVLVYFHGGAFIAGDGSEPRYDGASMARRGIVSVTVNYRLGVFGFLAHPELSREAARRASGNYGLLDQQAALQWVKKNIAAFGGDPARVTIAGQSAGAASVCAQMASPLSRGLFARAIGQSGAMLGTRAVLTLEQAEQRGAAFAAALQCGNLADLRRLPAEQLLERAADPELGGFPATIDGAFLPASPHQIFETGKQADVPLLGGWTSAEVGYESLLGSDAPTRENYEKAVRKLYGPRADDVLAVYKAENDDTVVVVATDLAADRFNGYNDWKWLDLHSKSSGSPVYRYLYGQPLPTPKGPSVSPKPVKRGAPHSADIAYALGNLALLDEAWTPEDLNTSEAMQAYFANFIRTGNPNGEGLVAWPWIQASVPHVMLFDGGARLIPEPHLRRYTLLDTLR